MIASCPLRIFLAQLLAAVLPLALATGLRAAPKPNVILILVDDLGWTDLGCMGSNVYQTPNIDRLAAEGMKFTDAYAACDLFCMPSTSEILPTVYLETWSYGKPVVGGKAHGLPELIEGNGAGVTVEQSAPKLAEALAHLLADPAERARLGEAGRRLVETRYSSPAVVGALEALYSTLLSDVSEDASLTAV